MRLRLLLPAVSALALLAALTPVAPARAACASRTTRSISGTVFGQDGRDVNVSIGIDLVDGNGVSVNADPTSAGYGCRKTGGYSMPQTYLNHFVSAQGAPQGSTMKDGTRTTRTWRITNIPSNVVGGYIEVYSRGYRGSPCKDSRGNWCFNPTDVSKYGFANKHLVPVGTTNLPIRLPMTCAYGGQAGAIAGRVVNAAGSPVAVQSVIAWTESTWKSPPFVHGWGIATLGNGGSYRIASLASGQTYVVWVTRRDGSVVKRSGVRVNACSSTPLTVKV